MEGDFSALQSAISSALVSTTRAASQLAAEDLPFHRSLDARFASTLERQNARLLGLATRLLGSAASAEETVRAAPTLKDIDAVDGNWRAVVDVVDSLLERADTAMDEFTGAVKRLSPGAEAQIAASRTPPRMSKIATQLKAQDMAKPQLLFEHVPTNRETEAFKPLLLSKPHAAAPLQTEPVAINDSTRLQYSHPYQLEIERYQYPTSIYMQADPILYHPFDSTTATFVDTEEALEEMLEELKHATEIAIDLEHHDQRSYVGIVCLIQISTRDRDWIIDTLKPWRRKLQILNEVFANPNIIKVLHGAYMDIVWLQRDFGLYLVGLFDTHYAARALGYTGGSLAFLLKKFVNVDAQKQYQMADWRVRPLPEALFDYARSDTHYLLYIFDCMRNELIERSDLTLPNHEGDKLMDVLRKSSEVALQRYDHPIYDFELGQGTFGWYKQLSRTPALFTKEQFAVFRAVHQWRDNVAREQDDSVHYVMPNHQIFSISRELPTNRAAVLGIAQPTTQSVRLRVDELVAIIAHAKLRGQDGPEMWDVLNQVEPHNSKAVQAKVKPDLVVAESVPKSTATVDTAPVSALPLRSATSTFWGAAFATSAHDQRREISTLPGISLTVPLPPLAAEAFAEPTHAASSTPVRSQPTEEALEPTPSRSQGDEDVIVLKELGNRRKRVLTAMETDGMANQNDNVAVWDDEAELRREKAERKKAKKDAKRASRAATGQITSNPNGTTSPNSREAVEEEPFDYTSAPSMLNPPREEGKARANRTKGVNPYAQAFDAPRGLPKAQKERAGKSASFK